MASLVLPIPIYGIFWKIRPETYGLQLRMVFFNIPFPKKEIIQHFVKSSRPGSLGDNNIRTLALDSSGNLWLGTDDGGICQFNHQGNQVQLLYQ
jgi:hypothetical protein